MIDDRTDAAFGDRPAVARAPATPALAGLTPALVMRAALRRKWLVVAVTVLTVLAVAFGASLLKPRFVATSQVFIDPRGLQVVQTDITANNVDSQAFTNLVESQVVIVLSDKVIRPVVDSTKLYADRDFAGRATVAEDTTDPAALEAARKAAAETLKRQTSVRRPERTSIIEITVTAATADRAAELANAIAQSYLSQVTATQAELAQRTTNLLNDRLDALQRRVRDAETRIQEYKTQNNLIGTQSVSVTEAQLSDVNARLTAARARVTEAQVRYDQILAAQRSPEAIGALPEAVGSTTIGNLRVQNVEARRTLASLSAVLGSQHPSVRAAAAQVEDTRRSLAAELGRVASSARVELNRAKEAEADLAKTLEALKGQVSDAGQASVQLRELEREADASRNVYQAFLARSRETGELAGLGATNASLVTAATPPPARSFPPRLSLLLVLGAVLGGLLGIALAVLLEMVQAAFGGPTAIGTAGEAGAALARAARLAEAVPPAAETAGSTVALLAPFPPAVRRAQERGQLDLRQIGLPVLVPGVEEHRLFLASVIDGIEPASAPSQPRCLMVAGVNAGLERTTLALNLALAAQVRGARVMLMDYDQGARALTGMVAGALRHPLIGAAEGSGRLFHPTLTGVGLILFPERTPMSQIDPLQICDTVFDGEGSFDLLVCDGPETLAQVRQEDGADLARIGIVLTVDAAAAMENLAGQAPAARILKVVAVSRSEPAAETASKPAA